MIWRGVSAIGPVTTTVLLAPTRTQGDVAMVQGHSGRVKDATERVGVAVDAAGPDL